MTKAWDDVDGTDNALFSPFMCHHTSTDVAMGTHTSASFSLSFIAAASSSALVAGPAFFPSEGPTRPSRVRDMQPPGVVAVMQGSLGEGLCSRYTLFT